ncbi:MAG: methyltransferase domain-containing protein [Patescibacteria group bacterium]
MAQAGAKFVFSIELSDSAITMVKRITNRFKDKVFVIQADIAHIPLKQKVIQIDLVYCINVIQHTKNIRKATHEITKFLSKKSDFAFNIYLERGRRKFLIVLGFVRIFTKYIPHIFLRYISLFVAFFCYVFSFLPFIGVWLRWSLPIRHGFKETWLDIYDILGSHKYQRFYTEKELQSILRTVGVKVAKRSRYALLLNKA